MTAPRTFALAISFMALAIDCSRNAQAQSASTASNTTRVTAMEAQATIEARQEQRLAEAWGLKREEWTRYRELMRGPLGIYSPNLDPLTALGVEARSEDERKRYARLQARMEGVRVQKLLAYQRAYDDAWKQLYPNQPRVKLSHGPQAAHVEHAPQTDTRLAVFVKADCPACDARVLALARASRPFDLYMVGTRGDDAVIRAWASRIGIDPKTVRARTITLNHDAGRWLQVGDGRALPAVLHRVNGQWQRE
jgi:integrating conjugative element protein (TIGR03759 family)